VDEHCDIGTLLLAGDGHQPGNILGQADVLLLDLDDDIAGVQPRFRCRPVRSDLRHGATDQAPVEPESMACGLVDQCEVPAGVDGVRKWCWNVRGRGYR
jgi:hypothetical protein